MARAPDLLVVSEGPSPLYRLATGVWPLVALFCWTLGSSELGVAPTLTLALLVMLALLWGWRTTAHRFDRAAGVLVITRSGPVRAARRRDVLLDAVAEVVDRRSNEERAVELVLADRSTLVVARTSAGSGALDSVAREVGELLHMPVNIALGSLVAGRFQIEDLVERGGMGVVYRALDQSTGERVALKLALAPIEDATQRERFAREIGLLAALDHPRIVRHLSHGMTADGRAYLAMEWLVGEDLRRALERGPLSLEGSLQVLRGAAEAIAVAHRHGVVHRDLKPGNLFLRGGGELDQKDVVLLDFGIARHTESATRLTGSKSILGTPHYMAPEQASSSNAIQPAADIFSLGCIFYECMTGTHPFDAPQLVGVLARILFDSPAPVEASCAGVPEPWSSLLTRMLAKEPDRRPTDGGALLAEILALPPVGAEPSGPRAPARPVAEGEFGDQVLVSVVLATLLDTPFGEPSALERFASIQTALRRFNCPIDRLADGSLLATISPRQSAADQARIASSCALYLRDILPEARISVATGRAALRRNLRVGDAVDRAVLLLEGGQAGDGIRIDLVTAGLLDGRFVTSARDGGSVLLGEKRDLDESRPLLGKPTPCVGRELELIQLEGLMASAADESVPKAAVVLGPPGIGKSRLRHELLRRLHDRNPNGVQLVGYGDPLSAGSPYVLVGDALRRHAGIRAGDAPESARAAIVDRLCQHVAPAHGRRVSEFLGELCGVAFPGEASPPLQAARNDHRVMSEQVTIAFLDWLSAECQAHSVAFVLEDVQWADALTLKLLEAALRDLQQARLSILALGRPEVEEIFPKLFYGQPALSLSLGVLGKKASESLVREVLGPALDRETVLRIVSLSAGNALFLEELIRAAAEGKGDDVPETVLAMLQARLSRLAPEARLVLRAASVLGERFWQGGLVAVAASWGAALDPTDQLAQLVDAELIERGRSSRLPDEVEYRFRHALVCDAAHGLLADADRRAGHLEAGRWLEAKGETDGAVLARHAEEGGDGERAILCYMRAAEQSLGQYDFGQALVRARRGVARGAQGHTLGVLESVQSAALYSLGQWLDAADVGVRALSLLPRGSAWWCATVEKLMQVLPNTNQLDKCTELSDELLQIVPAPEARGAYIRAVHAQLLGYAIAASHQRARASLAFIDTLGTSVSEPDVATRGYARLWRSVLGYILDRDMPLALSLSQQAIADLAESQVLYRLSLAHILQSFVWWGLGDLDRSERAARQGRAIAEQIHDDYHAALAAWYLAVALADRTDPAQLDEAEKCAWVMVLGGENPLFEAVSRCVAARVHLARGHFAQAENDARISRAGLIKMPPYGLMSSAYLVQALGAQRRWEEACALAREDLAWLDALGCPICSEVLFRVAAAEVLFGGGYRSEGQRVLDEALRQIALRAAYLRDPALQASYFSRHENRRAAELAVAQRSLRRS